MVKIIFSLLMLLLASNCVLIDTLGLNITKPTIKGSEAKSQILTSALVGAGMTSSTSVMATAIATYNIKKLKDSSFYDKDDVDKCANMVLEVNAVATIATSGIAIGQFACNSIREQKMFIDWPIPFF